MLPTSHRDLIPGLLWTLGAVLVAAFVDNPLIRSIAFAPLLLFFTGHAALRAIGVTAASAVEHVVYAVGASIAICVAGGFLLNWIGGLTPLGWTLWLAAAIGAATAVAMRRPGKPIVGAWRLCLPDLRMWHAAVLVVAACLTGGAYLLAVHDAAAQKEFKYTEFWMLPEKSAPGRVVIGIKSAEAQTRKFDIEVRFDGATVALWRSIAVAPGGTWTRDVLVTGAVPGRSGSAPHRAEALLYGAAGNTLYRKVSTILPGA